jgi:hypothetical protein
LLDALSYKFQAMLFQAKLPVFTCLTWFFSTWGIAACLDRASAIMPTDHLRGAVAPRGRVVSGMTWRTPFGEFPNCAALHDAAA